jgi:starch-binding outer membrane protein, SusD/RagB family
MKSLMRMMLLLPAALVLSSCRDVFDTQPLDRISERDVWRQEATLRSYLTDTYARFPWGGPGDFAGAGGEAQGTTPNPTQNSDDPAYWGLGTTWQLIRDLSVFIQSVDDAPISAAARNQMKGEAKVLRAMVYFEKQKRYGGVPVVDIPLDPFNLGAIDQRYLSRAAEEQVADFIDRELAEAAELLSTDHTRRGQINRWTAHAFKARANLWAATVAKFPSPLAGAGTVIGIPAGRAEDFYRKASAAADIVINSGRYSLYTADLPNHAENYRRLFITNSNPEVILERYFDGVNLQTNYTGTNTFQAWSSGFGGSNVSYDFLLRFEDLDGGFTEPRFFDAQGRPILYPDGIQPWMHKDPRARVMTWFQGERYGGRALEIWEGIDPSPVGTVNPAAVMTNPVGTYQGVRLAGRESRLTDGASRTFSGLHYKKYIEDGTAGAQFDNTNQFNSWKALRLAEMYLVKAEAEFELGNTGPASQALNITRQRAGMPPVEQVGGITRERVRTERTSELAFEGHRYWDLRRWRTAGQLDGLQDRGLRAILHFAEGKYYFLPSTSVATGRQGSTRTFQPHHYYNPMTSARRETNPQLVETPGY